MSFQNFKSTHSGRLDRWLGSEKTAELSNNMRGWYGPPIALQGVPGSVFATKDGDFIGDLRDGWEVSMMDHAWDLKRRLQRAARVASGQNRNRLNAGFTSLADLVQKITVGDRLETLVYYKVGTLSAGGASHSLWGATGSPAAGAVGVAAPGGAALNNSTVGAVAALRTLPVGDKRYLLSAAGSSSVLAKTLLLYDRLFAVKKNLLITTAEAVTGVPTRYQGTTPGTDTFSGGNFLFVECESSLSAETHAWTVCNYVNQNGAAKTLPLMTGNPSTLTSRLDQPLSYWFAPLASGDWGLTALTQIQQDATIASGGVNFVIGHPLAWIVHPIANMISIMEYTNTAFSLPPVHDNACLALLDAVRGSGTIGTYSGTLIFASG